MALQRSSLFARQGRRALFFISGSASTHGAEPCPPAPGALPDMEKENPMKPEFLHKLTGEDIKQYRRIDPQTRLVLVVLVALIATYILLIVRTL
ncbi:hypothetical protein [Mixta calida]|uniref:hypothetical protein n=1 Tax=Mixta calida TaxID=665913 RepID=UPI0034D487CE